MSVLSGVYTDTKSALPPVVAASVESPPAVARHSSDFAARILLIAACAFSAAVI